MANKLNLLISSLKQSIDGQKPREALQRVEIICNYFEEDLTNAEIDLAIDVLFSSGHGTIAILSNAIKFNKLFKDCTIRIFQLYSKLINLYKSKISKYSKDIIACLLKYIPSSNVTAREKEFSILVITDLVTNGLCQEDDILDLLDILFRIFNEKSPPARFLQHSFELIGLISKQFPQHMSDGQCLQFRNSVFQTLENSLVTQNKLSFPAMTGAINGLCDYLNNFGPSPKEEPLICQKIYNCIKNLSDPGDLKDKMVFRSSLNLIASHTWLMAEQLLIDYQYWHNLLQKWLSFPMNDRKIAIMTIHALHKELSNTLTNRKNNADIAILKFFMKFFKTTLQNSTSRPYEIRIAIRGFGLMAGPCKTLLPPEYLDDLLNLVIQRTEYSYLQDKGNKRDVLEHLPDFVQALSQIMGHVNGLSGIQLSSLQNIIITLIRDFHFLSAAHHGLVTMALMTTFYNLSLLGGTILEDLLQKIVLQGVIWTCSHKLFYDAFEDWGNNEINWKDNITFKSYLPLWNGLLKGPSHSEIDLQLIKEKIYDKLIENLFLILDKLDVTTKKKTFKDESGIDQEFYFCDPNMDLDPVKPKDFHIFFNVVDFYKDLLKSQSNECHNQNFPKWINQYFEIIITKYHKFPLISGFLKLLETGMVIANEIDYFNEEFYNERIDLHNMLNYFLKTIINCSQSTSGELQIANLRFIFIAPVNILRQFIMDLVPIFIVGFDIGRSMLWLANMALTALQKLTNVMDYNSEDLHKFLQMVLPSLDVYLQSKGFLDSSRLNVEIVRDKNKRNMRKLVRENDTDSELLKFQKRIILFLGTLEPTMCRYMLRVTNEIDENLIKWDINQNIKLPLQCVDMTPTIFLDTLIPRISHLALTSSDRKTKIVACELIHGVILYVIGINNFNSKIWPELCNRMLYLGCDSDIAVRQMFEPLLMQIMHYMAQPSQLLNVGVEKLLDSLMESISHPSNTAIRDLSARCLREFLSWTLKQTTSEIIMASPLNIIDIITRLNFYSNDFNSHKRLGAALAFNNLYRILREYSSILDRYWLILLHTFCNSLLISEKSTDTIGNQATIEQVSSSLDHIVRVICERKHIFNKESDNREIPLPFSGPLLKHAVLWLFQQCGSNYSTYRRKCVEIFTKIVPCVDGFQSVSAFIGATQQSKQILEICEGKEEGIKVHPDLLHIKESKISAIILIHSWLQYFLASLDNYVWLFGDRIIINSDEIFAEGKLFNVIIYFLNEICWNSMADILSKINSNYLDDESSDELDLQMSIEKIQAVNHLKCTIIMKITDLFVKLLPICSKSFPMIIWAKKSNLIQLIICIIFRPHELGFDFNCQDDLKKLPQSIENLLTTVQRYAPSKFTDELYSTISKEFIDKLKAATDNAQNMLHADTVRVQQMNAVNGIELIFRQMKNARFSNLSMNFIKVSAEKLLNDLFVGVKEEKFDSWYPIYPPPDVRRYANVLIKICFHVENLLPQVVTCILCETELKFPNTTNKGYLKHGEHFVEIYKKSLFDYLLKTADQSLDLLIKKINDNNIISVIQLFNEMSEYVFKYKNFDKQCMKTIVNIFIANWNLIFDKMETLKNVNNSTDLFLIELISHIGMISPYPLDELREKIPNLEIWLLELISNKENSLNLKAHALMLLPCITGPKDVDNEKLSVALLALQSQHFPLLSTEFPSDSLEISGLVTTMRTLLDALTASRSPIVLKFLIDATAADEKHIMEYDIQKSLTELMESLSTAQQEQYLKLSFDVFCNTTLEPSIRSVIMKRFLCTLLRATSISGVILFFEKEVKKIVDLSESNYGFSVSGRGWNVEHALISRAGSYQLFEVLFGSVQKERMTTISYALLNTTGTEIVNDLTKRAYKVRSEIFVTDDPVTGELFRKYQCYAYRALCTIVSNTKTELKFYNGLLFKEIASKNDFIWQKMINCRDDNLFGDFPQDFEEYPKIKDRIVSIRRTAQGSDERKSVKYLQTTSVFMSSLSQDITKLDFNNSVIRTTAEAVARDNADLTGESISIELEKMQINDHELMPTLCALVQHMYENNITPVPENLEHVKKAAPQWVEAIANALSDSAQHKNVRLFLSKLVENCREVFKYYAPTLLGPIMQVIVDGCAGNFLNVFITDLVVMILSWSHICLPTDTIELGLATSLLEFLMKNAYHDRKEIFKLNLEIIKNVVEVWKDVISLPRQLLYNMITETSRTDSRANICGIQLNSIILANGLVPWTELTKVNFIRAIFTCLDNEYTVVYQPAAQLLGMCLLHINPKGEIDDDPCSKELKEKITTVRRTNEKKFMDILYGIHKYYPVMVDPFMVKISGSIPTSMGAIKRIYLEMFLSRAEYYGENIFRELITLGIKDLLKQNEFQLLALHIINKSIPKMNVEEINSLMEDLCSFVDNKYPEYRDLMYEILIFIKENIDINHPIGYEVAVQASTILLNGLTDLDSQVQNRIFKFWSNESQLPTSLADRFLTLLGKLYNPRSEKQFLVYTTQLLLELAIQNPNSKRQLFIHQQDYEGKLKEYAINVNWRTQYSAVTTPLFVESQRRPLLMGDGSQMEKILRATASQTAFEPTQDPSMLVQTSNNFTLQSQSSLLFTIQPQLLDRRSQRISEQQGQQNIGVKSFNNLRKRFLRDQEKLNRERALKAIERHGKEKDQQSQTKKQKEGNVVLYRRYRVGDFPDLLINGLALLLPLQGLVKRDHIITRQIFVALFYGIISELGPNQKQYVTSVDEYIQNIFNSSKNCEPNVFAALLEVALTSPKLFNLPPDTVAVLSNASNMMTLGALYIESQLNIDWDTERLTSKSSTSSIEIEPFHWLKLAEIYHEISEQDVVTSIFSDKIKTDPQLTVAIEYETNGDFLNAQRIYAKLITSVQCIEQDFCYQSFYNCYMQMGMWSELNTAVMKQLGDWDELWTDTWNQEHLLSHIMRSQLRLILNDECEDRIFLDMIEKWLHFPERADYLKINYGEELMMLNIANKDYRTARVYSEQHISYFLAEWRHFNILSNKLREGKLLNIRKVAEIHKYANLLLGDMTPHSKIQTLQRMWKKSNPAKTDNAIMWDFLIAYRSFIWDSFQASLASQESMASDNLEDLNQIIIDMKFKFLNAVIAQKNVQLSENIISRLSNTKGANNENALKWSIARCKHQLLKAEKRKPAEALYLLIKGWDRISQTLSSSKDILKSNPEIHIDVLEEVITVGQKVASLLKEFDIDDAKKKIIYNCTPSETNELHLEQRIHQHSLNCFQQSIQLAVEVGTNLSTLKSNKLIAAGHRKLAQYCYDQFNNRSDSSTSFISTEESNELEKLFIASVFRAMHYGSTEAQQLFPIILQLSNISESHLSKVFIEESSNVPEWMFLGWLPQILSQLNFSSVCYLDDLLQRIATAYPAAVIFPYHLSYGQYKQKSPNIIDRSFIYALWKTLRNSNLENFMDSLGSLCVPQIMLITHITNLRRLFKGDLTNEKYQAAVKNLMKNIYPKESFRGKAFEVLTKYKEQLGKLTDFHNVDTDRDKILKFLDLLSGKLKESVMKSNLTKIHLEELCPWLAYFMSSAVGTIELPGQYTGEKKPIIENHVKIFKFGQNIDIFESLRKPMKIKIFGTDGKSYDYLVKYGEDLRQDQRIQQLLSMMSTQLANDKNCQSHNLIIQTYQVIPVSHYCGMTTWVNDTIVVKDLIIKSLHGKVGDVNDFLNRIKMDHHKLLSKPATTSNKEFYYLYGNAVSNLKREKIMSNFTELRNRIPDDLIRKAFTDISVSPESYFILRNNFARSLAAINIAHWILGIGDRHLSNMLFNIKNGTLVGVDFGMVFGAGIRDISVPEMIPFRLTPHFVTALNPFGVSGLLSKCMGHSLRSLRECSKLLMACMEIFVKEPTIEWTLSAQQFNIETLDMTIRTDDSITQWDAEKRILITKRKLSGANPKTLIAEQMADGVIAINGEYLQNYIKILNGHKQFNIRARLPDIDLSVEEQVNCLIDLATDPAILGVTFAGFEPWI